jgi:heme exporter protein C
MIDGHQARVPTMRQDLFSSRLFGTALFLTAFLIGVAQYLIFLIVPTERVMGAAQRIFYFHVGGAIACYAGFFVLGAACLWYVATRAWQADLWALAAGEVTFLLCSVTLVTGMIWGKTAWNTWFSWSEPRLVTFLLLWLILFMLNMMRSLVPPDRVANHAAVVALIGTATVPAVQFSIHLLPKTARLHPEVVAYGRLEHWSYWWAFGISVTAMIALAIVLIVLRFRIAALDRRVRLKLTERLIRGAG